MSQPGFTPDDSGRKAARHALDLVLTEALSRRDILDALAARRIPVDAARLAVAENRTVQARFREEQERLDTLRLSPDDVYVEVDAGSPMTPGEILWLGAIFMFGVGYLSLVRWAWSAMPFVLQAFVVVGFLPVLGLSVLWAVDGMPSVRAWLGLDPERASPGSQRQYMLAVVVLPELWQFINDHREPLYSTTLTASPGPALYAEQDDAEIIVTGAGRHLQRILSRSESGAVALAGHRGSGKTTAIRSVSRGLLSDPATGRPPLAIQSSAPARYDARDFVLHLHALLCNAILARINPRYADNVPDGRERQTLARRRASWRWIRRVLILCVLLAGIVAAGSLVWHIGPLSFFARLRLLVESVVTGFPVWSLPLSEVGLLLGCVATVGYAVVVAVDVVLVALGGLFRLVRRLVPPREDLVLLTGLAERQLDRIRFLQTFTTGWSGKVSTPLSGEAARTWSTQRAEQRPTYPEVVEEFRRFAAHTATQLKSLGLNDRLVIAIDEVDKIGEPEKAHEFVNDIKGIFGVPGCLFLVSVSDDALSTFERRGIAVRDAFDSAFSEMVHVEYFTLDESRTWINRRVRNVPEQFSHLCHCLSGGLPRDLRRHTIEMLDITTDVYHPNLATVTKLLVRRELDRKAHAFAGTARTLDDTPELSDLMAELVSVRQTAEPPELVQLATRLTNIQKNNETHPINPLRRQSGCFILFCATILETFDDNLTEPDMPGTEVLAQARQQMAIDSQLAWRLLTKFRAGAGLSQPTPAD
ncbi:hypothetical protein [Actinocrispum wychmicini]|uniref:KAP-like P-loop domain-containing protein n=1 Tax=Actinocrispum wychmicini TaxID=1213861 RepID=A0A4R2JE90_9PSEU|nr:hypothetical protein [Actinocrispum wychmicini]TCO55138.1 hypothetical protein EV192_108426 [Actinocrispum wychmicini]